MKTEYRRYIVGVKTRKVVPTQILPTVCELRPGWRVLK